MRSKLLIASILIAFLAHAEKIVFHMEDYGIVPEGPNLTQNLGKFIQTHSNLVSPDDSVVMKFKRGRYVFYMEGSAEREYYVSNHDQSLKRVVFDLSGWKNLTIDGAGSSFLFSGTVIPFALNYTENCTLKNFSIDFIDTKMVPMEIVKSDSLQGITFTLPQKVKTRLTPQGALNILGEGWNYQPTAGMAFEGATGRLAYLTGEFEVNLNNVTPLSHNTFCAPLWRNTSLKPGMVVAARDWSRPTPAIFVNESRNIRLHKVTVHYAEGMGLLAQRTENISLYKFNVCLQKGSRRYFTTHADATHFSQCRGKIVCTRGLYEGMMDDAINVHGIYLKVLQRIDPHTLICTFAHPQAWGFNWGNTGDSVQFVNAATMEAIGTNIITAIRPHDKIQLRGMHAFRIELRDEIDSLFDIAEHLGIENLTWTPEVEFSHNIVRNNRARGALFSSPRRTLCQDNTFDHVSGTAILLCGDCNGWYESGACKDITIIRNKFINCLTNYFQFTNAVISIYPEIPQLEQQQKPFHSGIRIENNKFVYFDQPLLYAKSVDGLIFRNNRIVGSKEYPPFHWNKQRFKLEHVSNAEGF